MELSKEVKGYLMQEAYYGKLPEFNEMEKLFDSIIARVKKEKEKSNPNKYPEMKKISKLFCKIFGFKKEAFFEAETEAKVAPKVQF